MKYTENLGCSSLTAKQHKEGKPIDASKSQFIPHTTKPLRLAFNGIKLGMDGPPKAISDIDRNLVVLSGGGCEVVCNRRMKPERLSH